MSSSETLFPVVGIGASAGGLEAISELLAELPAKTGMAFLLVQHLAPKHESFRIAGNGRAVSAELLKRHPSVFPNANAIYASLVEEFL